MALLGVAAISGCVERELSITSEPEGALVFVSDREVGRTPLSLRHGGPETLKTHAEINPPWYELPPLDLLSHVVPWTYHDRRYLHYQLDELKPVSDEELIKRADAMKDKLGEPSEE